jgi:hypothetical protein
MQLPPRSARRLAGWALLAALGGPGTLHAASPSLGAVTPHGGQRGTELPVVLSGGRLSDAKEILFYYPGITTAKLEVVNDGQVKAVLKIAADCRLGEHALRLRTASGISDLRTFYVGALPGVDEVEPNGDFQHPQKVALNVTISGVVQGEDVDYYSFEAKKGDRVTAEIEGMRLGHTVFDPAVAILNQARFELAFSDDSPLLAQDAVASVLIPEDGTYLVQVREGAYGGNDACVYRLHLGGFPRPLAVLPAGGRPGEELEVTFLGDVKGEIRKKVKLPDSPAASFGLFAEDPGGIAPSANPFRLFAYPNVLEKEPNDRPEEATRAEVPCALNGVIGSAGDRDLFRFSAKKGQTFEVQLYGRRLRSPLDSVMTLSIAGGGVLASNDDAVGPDSYFRFTAPEDKEYLLEIRDHLGKGGPTYTYRVEVAPVEPRLSVSIPKVALYSQERQAIAVCRGNRSATLLAASRADFGGDLTIAAEGLPAGVGLVTDKVAADVDQVPAVFEAAPGAPLSGGLAKMLVRPVDPAAKVAGGFSQVVELTYGSPGQSVYWRHQVDRVAVAVTEEAPFKIAIVEPKVPLVQNGSMNLKVVAERKEGFKAAIAVQMVYNPPGVGSAGGVSIPEGQNEALIPINANSGAPPRPWKIAVSGTATVGNGPVWVSSQLATLVIAPPYVSFQMERSAVEQGKETEVFAKVEHHTPFQGAAKVRLLGLPPRVSAPEMEITRETKDLAFKVKAEPASPPGQHKTLFCQLVIVENGEPIVHSVGGTELRIDVPLPPKPNAAPPPAPPPAAAKKPEEPKPPVERRLTRLEKLRLEQAERQKDGKEKP